MIPSRLKQLKGKATKPITFDIERGQIKRFAAAIGEQNSLHFDDSAAESAGFSAIVAPLTFPAALIQLHEWIEELGLDMRTTMHAEEEYEYFRPICAGDSLQITHRIVDAYEKQAPNGKLNFIVVESRATDKKSRDVFKGRRILVELKT